jgi:transposase
MGIQTFTVTLPKEEKEQCQQIIHSGTTQARTMLRAHVLLLADEGKKDREIYSSLHLAKTTPFDIRKRYHTEGLKRALFDLPRPGQKRKLSVVQEAEVVAIACTKAPKGYDHWTMDLLTEEVQNKLGISIGRTAIWKVLLRNDTKPWRKKNVVHPHNYA